MTGYCCLVRGLPWGSPWSLVSEIIAESALETVETAFPRRSVWAAPLRRRGKVLALLFGVFYEPSAPRLSGAL
jgi:hypothetical protein